MSAPRKPSASISSRGSGAHPAFASSPYMLQKPYCFSERASRATTTHCAVGSAAHRPKPDARGRLPSPRNIAASRSRCAPAVQAADCPSARIASAGKDEVLPSSHGAPTAAF
eukprot:7385123-Prymnesium_polylepis.1